MNRTFKVASNKLRGCVVCSEKASSYQGRAVKTVIAAAVAALTMGATAAMAAEGETAAPETPDYVWQDKTITEDVTPEGHIVIESVTQKAGTLAIGAGVNVNRTDTIIVDEKPVNKSYSGKYTLEDGKITVADQGNFEVRDFTMKAGSISATGETLVDEPHGRTQPAFGAYNTFVMESGTADLSKGGRIWIGTANKEDPAAYNRMELKGGTVNLTDGGYITGNKRVIKAGKYYNDTVVVEKDTLGYNTIGFDGAQVNVKGNGNVIDAVATELTAGELNIAKGADLTVRATVSTNQPAGTVEQPEKVIAQNSNFTVTGGTLKNEGELIADVSQFVVKGGTVENTGRLQVKSLTVSDAGTVSTVYTRDNFQFDTVTLLEGGTLKLDALNSRVDGEKITDKLPGDRLLLNDGSWALEGGKLAVGGDEQYTGEVKIGRADTKADLWIAGGSYEFSKISFGSSNKVEGKTPSSLTVMDNTKGGYGQLKVGELDFSNGKVDVKSGVLTVEKLVHDGKGQGTFNLEDELITTGDQIFVKGEGEDGKWGLTAAAQHMTSTEEGFLTITDTFSTTADKILAANKLFAGDKQNLGQIFFENLTITGDKEGESKVTFNQDLGLAAVNSAVTAPASKDKAVTLTIDSGKMVGVGTLAVDENAESIVVAHSKDQTGVGTLVVGGTEKGGNVFSKNLKSVYTDGGLVLGIDSDRAGTLNADAVTVFGDLEVEGNWAAKDLVINGRNNDVTGTLALEVLSSVNVAGAGLDVDAGSLLKASSVGVDVDLGEGATLVLGDRVEREVPVVSGEGSDEGVQPIADASSSDSSAASQPQTQKKLLANIEANVNAVEAGAVVTTNDNGRQLLAERAGKAFDAKKNVGIYVDDTVSVSDQGRLVVGDLGQYEAKQGSVSLGSNAVAVVDLNAFEKDQAVFDAGELYLDGSTTVLLNGADKISTTVLATGEVTGATVGKFKTDNAFLATSLEEVKDKTTGAVTQTNLVIGYNDDVTKDPVGNVVKDMLTNGSNAKNLEVIHAVGQSGYITAEGKLSAEGVQALSEYVTMPVTAGLYNAAYDAQNAFTGAVQERALEKGQSYGVWANAYYAQNEAKKLYGDTGYKSDIYGGVMGADATFSCGARLGAAFTFGKADVDSKNTVNPVNTDSDFWGLSIYTAKDFAGVNVAADVSYVSLGNDISGSISGVKMDESVDSTVWTVGVKGEAAVYETSNFAVVPHVGIRYAAIDVDDYRGIEAEKLNVIEMPLGVTVRGSFETAGLVVKPFVDFTAAPQLGDKEVDTLLGETDVLGHVYNAKLGVEASTGAFTFGAHYSYGFGSDDRANNVFGVKASYNF